MTERREYTAQDAPQFDEAEKQLAANHLDVKAARATDLIDEFFQKNRDLPVTVANIFRAVEERKTEFKWFGQAEFDYYAVANQEPDRANQLSAWLATQGNPGQLVYQGDEAFDNLRLLLLTLRGYEINTTTISHAIDRVQSKSGPKLRFAQAPRRAEPISPAEKADDGTPFLGRNLNEPEWARRSRERSEREAKEAANQPSAASVTSRGAAEAREKAESLQGSTHTETDQLKKIFVTSGTEIDWQATLASRLRMQAQFDKQRAVRRFIR